MKKGRLVVPVLLSAICLLSYLWYRSAFVNSLRNAFQNCYWSNKNENTLNLTTQPPKKTDLQMKIDAMFDRIEKLIPIAPFTHFNRTTSGKHSKAFIANPKEQYCVGEELVVQIDMFDHLGNRKRHGGDFIRARLFSSGLGASVSGQLEDLNNGSYHVRFHLYWAGDAKVSIWLFHPSEGVAPLWRSRHASQGALAFEGKFEMLGKYAVTKCAFKLYEEEGKEICEYLDPLYEEAFYCFKAPNFTCESLNEMRGYHLFISHITPDERKLFERSNIAVDIPQTFDSISINACRVVAETPKPKCQTGMGSPLPSGYFYNNIWQPVYCNMTVYNTGEDFLKCLERKKLFLIGDSTMHQFIMHFTGGIKIVKYFRYHGSGGDDWYLDLEAMNTEKDIYVSYKRHGFPLEHPSFYYFKEDMYTSRQIDQRAGGKDTIFVITLGQHFRLFPIKIFIKRVLNIRRAVERLLLRSPDTKVIIKSENTRELQAPVEMKGDLYGYPQYLVLREVFQGINVGFVDAWDMTVAAGSLNVHPYGHTFASIMSLAFSFAC
ncbi:PREDICTED: NXPE family member 4-like [Nanorana parkeri]|uniref:NXPE family member 4-like n=1 Tax=Nanorana parkeri TaxID=125878 RepID=UPI000854E713|nr:PREDICTED: NXPE family member 4-like [Nanorana parkeri]